MSKLFNLIKRAPKRTAAIISMIGLAVIVPATLFAWGPDRPTFTMDHPADHITFNSITDNPNIGDERNFVGIRESGTNNLWTDNMTVESGKTYTVRMYVHNNAASNLNLVAHDVTATFNLPTNTGKSIRVDGFIDSSNASPTEVYDSATFNSSQDFNLAYVSGSLEYENNVFGSNGAALSESIFTASGVKLGYDKLDGNIPGCLQYAGYVSFSVKPQFGGDSKFTMSKMVSKHSANKWVENYEAQPGEVVDFLIQYKNVGTTQHNDVTFRDSLPAGLTYVDGSTIFGNALAPNGTKASDNLTNGTGINVGYYAPGANAWVIFSAKVASSANLACGSNKLVNTAKVTTDGGSISDIADVTVGKTCDLPHTGASENLLATIGAGTVVTTAGYYIASRRALMGRQ
ncbi:DUF11 domain-containing protein [Candidatus Saccharibacteria bacterium]|nr:DUF11 domain-containing protein [Candidatus Saccharibacteria bacterium]